MKIGFSFPSSVAHTQVSAGTGVAYIWDSVGTSSSAVASGWWPQVSAEAGLFSGASAEMARQFWFNFTVFQPSASSGVFSSSALKTGLYSYIVTAGSGTFTGQFDVKEEARDIRNTYILQAAFAALTGSQVVNTNLNESILYEDGPDANGAVATSAARSRILARYKLYNAYGEGTSNNPVIKEASQVAFDDYIFDFLTGGVGSGLK